jgi:hypothetical protein
MSCGGFSLGKEWAWWAHHGGMFPRSAVLFRCQRPRIRSSAEGKAAEGAKGAVRWAPIESSVGLLACDTERRARVPARVGRRRPAEMPR